MEQDDKFAAEVHERLYKAFQEAARHKRMTMDESGFEMHLYENLELLYRDIMRREYHPSPGIAFVVEKPVIREIFAAPFRDRVVHHFLFDLTEPWWNTRLNYDAYSCRKGKGTLFGVKRLSQRIRKVTKNYKEEAIVAKFDIQGYFMSLPRKGLYERVLWGLDRQFPNGGPMYDLLKYLWKEIIFDDPTKGVKRRGGYKKWELVPYTKSLFHQVAGKGIVIGNLSSQLLSNMYLDPFDRFVTRELGYKNYGRYVDDFYIVIRPDELPKLKEDIELMRLKLADMGLTLHPKKTKIQPASRGVEFLGVVIYPGREIPGRRIMKNFETAMWEVEMGIKSTDTVVSYLGLLKHYNSKTMISKVFDKVGWEWEF